jgi:hypothetical protein
MRAINRISPEIGTLAILFLPKVLSSAEQLSYDDCLFLSLTTPADRLWFHQFW